MGVFRPKASDLACDYCIKTNSRASSGAITIQEICRSYAITWRKQSHLTWQTYEQILFWDVRLPGPLREGTDRPANVIKYNDIYGVGKFYVHCPFHVTR